MGQADVKFRQGPVAAAAYAVAVQWAAAAGMAGWHSTGCAKCLLAIQVLGSEAASAAAQVAAEQANHAALPWKESAPAGPERRQSRTYFVVRQ